MAADVIKTSSVLTPEVLSAYHKSKLVIARRMAIYEADGKTLWGVIEQNRLVEGSISVNSDQDERRTISMTLDNKDRRLNHNPNGGFWYDKIIKVYRGLIYKAPRRVALAGRNYVPNSSFTTISGVTAGGSAINTISTEWALYGTTSLKVTAPASGGGSTAAYPHGLSGAMAAYGLTAGKTYTISATIHLEATQTGTLDSSARRISVGYNNGTTINYGYALSPAAPNLPGTYRLSATFVMPSDATQFFVRLMNGAQNASQAVWWDGMQIEDGSKATSYFDGDTANNSTYQYLWDDTKKNSYKYLLAMQTFRYEAQVGEFMIDSISSKRYPNMLDVSGRDYTKKMLLDQFASDTAFPAGSKLDTVVRTIATNAGILKFRLNSGGVVLGAQATFARGVSRWEACKSMAESLNTEIYFDREGYLVTRPYQDVSTAAPTFILEPSGADANIVDFSKASSDSNIFNHIVVVGTSEEEAVSGVKFMAVLENHDPSSPTAIEKIGRRTYIHEVGYLQSKADAMRLCSRLFRVKQLEDFTLTFSTVCVPWIEAGRVMQFKDPKDSQSVPTRFLYSSFDIPLTLGPMSGVGKRIIDVSNTDDDRGDVSPATVA